MIVNTAAGDLRLSRNPCASTLSNVAGPMLQRECDRVVANGHLPEWDFAKTKAGMLSCQFVYHAVCGGYSKNIGQAEKVILF